MSIVYTNGRSEVCLPYDSSSTVDKIYNLVTSMEGISRSEFYLTFNGKCLQSNHVLTSPCAVRFHLTLPGGKGGFGSMLRAIGARIEKTTNHEACRDLSGRRMRDVNNEKAIAEWVKTKGDEEERKQKRVAKLEKIINPHHNYQDTSYTSNIQGNADRIDEALKSALLKRDEKSSKRKLGNCQEDTGKQRKKRMWIGVEDEDEESDEGEHIVAVGDDEPCCSKDSMGNFEDIRSRCVDEQVERSDLYSPVHTTASQLDSHICNSDSNTADTSVDVQITDSSTITSILPANSIISSDTSSITASTCTSVSSSTSTIASSGTSTAVSSSISTVVASSATTNSTSHSDDANHVDSSCNETGNTEGGTINLNDYDSAQQLQIVGLDRLKTALMLIGLKCGGTLEERAQRLFLTKSTPLDQLDRSLFKKASKGKNRKK